MRKKKAPKREPLPLHTSGELWLKSGNENFLGRGRIELLEAVQLTGSITQAAKKVGVSYKTAWDTVDILNNLSVRAVVESSSGGKKGGGTHLTAHGQELLRIYRVLQTEHERFLESLGRSIENFDQYYRFIHKISMRLSPRNQLNGRILEIRKGELEANIVINLKGPDKVTAEITLESVRTMDLRVGDDVYALIKATWVGIGRRPIAPVTGMPKSINNLYGKVSAVKTAGPRTEVILQLKGGNTIVSQLSSAAAAKMELKKGIWLYAGFAASNVIVGVQG